ncbi:MAG: choice-of-anchor D domain-containing protein [Pseudomonadota bacterium]|nr:choice-of-anchor D domain-containing protein [Pseudomonadota bacterium]
MRKRTVFLASPVWGMRRVVLALTLLVLQPAQGAVFNVQYADPPGSGFLDELAASPLPGNPGITLGQQRRNVMKHAAATWGSVLGSDAEILVEAAFSSGLFCSADSAVLGGATTQRVFSDFPGAPAPGVWYPGALADALAGEDLCANPGNRCAGEPDIVALFNANLDGGDACLGGRQWYYGLDHDAGNDLDFLNVLLHELAHGLGFQTFTDKASGEYFGGKPSIYDLSVLDLSMMLGWHEMTAAQRRVSATHDTRIVWNGSAVTAASDYLDTNGKSGEQVMLFAPNSLKPGSSISHWDTRSQPDTLMEPGFNRGLTGSRHLDLTPCLLHDLGWDLGDTETCFASVPDHALILPSAGSLDFGTTAPGEASRLAMYLENPASAPFDMGSIDVSGEASGEFNISGDLCSQTRLSPGDSCEIELTFSPVAPGTYHADLRIQSDTHLFTTLSIPLSGTVAGAGNVLGASGETSTGGGGGGALFALLPLLLLLGPRRGSGLATIFRSTRSGALKTVYKAG